MKSNLCGPDAFSGNVAKWSSSKIASLSFPALMVCVLCGCASPSANLSISKTADLLNSNSAYSSTGVFHVRGRVAKPGSYALYSATTLTQAIATAGGISGHAPAVIEVLRTRGKTVTLRFDLDKIQNGTAKDPRLRDGDLILIPE